MHELACRKAGAAIRRPQALAYTIPGDIQAPLSVKFWGPTGRRCLQVKDQGPKKAKPAERRGEGMRAARALTGEEWQHHFAAIVDKSYKMLRAQGITDVKLKFAFDNCNSHNIKGMAFPLLQRNCGTECLLFPPTYSGDFMQVIEHAHAVTTREYYRRYMQGGGSTWDAAKQWECLRQAFFSKVTAEWVHDCAKRVPVLAAEVHKQQGRYVDSKYI